MIPTILEEGVHYALSIKDWNIHSLLVCVTWLDVGLCAYKHQL